MLHIFRQKNVRRNVLWLVSGIIIISFGFGFGISSYSGQLSLTDAAGKVFGRRVSMKEFMHYRQATLDQAILMHGEKYQRILPMIDMENETWTRLMLAKEADRRQIKATDGEVVTFLQQLPFFQRDGGFDPALYNNIVKTVFQRDARAFEEGIRDQIKIMKMFRAETAGIRVADDVVRKEYERRNQKTQVSFILIDPATFTKDVQLDETALKAYYDAHREEFLTPDAVKVAHVLFPVAPDATTKEKAVANAKAESFARSLGPKANMAELAKTMGVTVEETGFFSMEEPDTTAGWTLDLLQQIFSAKKGAVLPPAQTDKGLEVLMITDLRPATIPAFETVKEAVREKAIAERALASAKTKAEALEKEVAAKMIAGTTFAAAAKSLGVETKKTPFFMAGDYIPEVGISEDFQTAAFGLTNDKRLSPIILTAKGPALLYWEGTEAIDETKFEEVKTDFSATLYEEERVAAMNRLIKEVKERAGLESYLDKVAKK